MLRNPVDAMLDIHSSQSTVRFRYVFCNITDKLIARRALLFKVQRVTRVPRLRCLIALFSTDCRQNRTQTAFN